MKKLLLLSVLFLFQIHMFSANIALLISIQGEGVFKRNGVEQPLKISQAFQANDKIVLKSGKATLMYFSGNEVAISPGVAYVVVETETKQDNSSLYALANNESQGNLLSQSGNLYSIRGQHHVFPTKAKVGSTDSLIFVTRFEKADSLKFSITLKESKMQKVVFTGTFSDTIISIKKPNLEAGKTYHWTISGTPQNIPELGTLAVVDVLQNSVQFETRAQYIQAICDSFMSSFYIRALGLCIEAKKKFPDTEIFNVLYENLLI